MKYDNDWAEKEKIVDEREPTRLEIDKKCGAQH